MKFYVLTSPINYVRQHIFVKLLIRYKIRKSRVKVHYVSNAATIKASDLLSLVVPRIKTRNHSLYWLVPNKVIHNNKNTIRDVTITITNSIPNLVVKMPPC